MNVLLVITNIHGFHEIPYSFGLSSIASYIQSKGHGTKIIAIRNEDEFDNLISVVRGFKPEVVGFSAVSSQFNYVKKLAGLVKNVNREISVVCGGVHPTLYPEALPEGDIIDGFFVGESEWAFGEYLDKIKNEKDYHYTNNYVYRNNGKLIRNPLNPLIQNLDELPIPVKGPLFEEYINKNGYAPFFFSRGCPYSCSYCSNHALAKKYDMATNKPRYRPVDSCIQEIRETSRIYRFDKIWIMDDTFGLNKSWREEFCQKYKKEIGIDFVCLLRANIVTESFIKTLKSAGCYRIMFGVESGNEYVRNTIMNRNMSDEQIVEAFRLCRKYEIESCSLNIIGVPGETEEMIQDTINFNKRIKPTDSAVNIFYPYKGTKLGDYCFSENLVDEILYHDFSNERRDSVLKYPEAFKARLRYYQKNWDVFVHPFDLKKRTYLILQDHKSIHNLLRRIKRFFV